MDSRVMTSSVEEFPEMTSSDEVSSAMTLTVDVGYAMTPAEHVIKLIANTAVKHIAIIIKSQ